MTPDELRDKAVQRYELNRHAYRDVVDAAIAVALEEAAKVADDKAAAYEAEEDQKFCAPIAVRLRGCADAIRALIK